MAKIILETKINAPIERCFDLSRSIDLHKISTAHTKEKAIDGCTQGLIELNEFVTWQAVHFGISQKLTSKITQFERPIHFRDEQIKGIFKFMQHDHYFEEVNGTTKMTDHFNFAAPLGLLGKLAELIFLKFYLKNLLIKRNQLIKDFAEGDEWKKLLMEI